MLNLEDRIGEFLVPHLKDFIFEELSESFLEKLGLADVMTGVPVPLRKTELNKITILAAKEYLEPIMAENVDTLIMGCTHYPVIKDIIADIMGPDVKLISSGAEAAKYAYNCLIEKDLLSDREEKGKNTFYVSDSVSLFEENAGNFLGHPVNGEVFSCSLGD